ncbi:MAG: Mbov_0395 family pilin-like conjugal transfer protein [Candidatus Saccharimonadales bacterium]
MKKILIAFFTIFAVATACFYPVAVSAADAICDNTDGLTPEQIAAAGCGQHDDPTNETFSTLRTVLNSVYFAVGITAVGVVIFGGFRFSLSQGDPGKVKRAKDTIMYAIIGLIIVLSAFAITNFILGII